MTQNPLTNTQKTSASADENRTGYELSESFHRITDVLKCKWTLAIVNEMNAGSNRPSAMQRELPGLTSKVLTDRLKKLEAFGLIEREVFAEVPPRVEYTLTERGQELMGVLESVIAYIDRWDG
tara:strand:- start:118564 stop:118932 length:369 start_codon:yes stop_codon:yes gene_type:complete